MTGSNGLVRRSRARLIAGAFCAGAHGACSLRALL